MIKRPSGLVVPGGTAHIEGINEFLARKALGSVEISKLGIPQVPIAQPRHSYRAIRHHKGRKQG
jgi:hypothetical protein